MHTVKEERIEKKYNPYIEKISQKLKDMYGHIKF